MRNKKIIYAVIILLLTIFSMGFTQLKKGKELIYNTKEYQHVEEMKKGADPSLGITELNEGFQVSSDFTSHLPLVIIDTQGNSIPEAYRYDKEQKRFVLKDENIDPYVNGKISIIDNENSINTLSDEADLTSNIKIKYRGNSSLVYEKHQYRIKLLTEDGQNNKQSIMGMEPNEDWIINISMIDSTLIRNYMVYNIAAKLMPFTPEVKYCEVILKDGDNYTYEGLYLMMESIKHGPGRVDIEAYDPDEHHDVSYILRRDRYDDEDIMIEDTYALNNNLGYGYLGIKYPKQSEISEKTYDYIYNYINTLEEILYSDDKQKFLKYNNYIDEDSFVDYFLINEYFSNYDAGNNSTYLYKDVGEKLKIGPVWDYDNAIDNVGKYILDTKSINFQGQTWFNELVKSESFCKKLKARYAKLSRGILSKEYIDNFIDETIQYLGNAKERDWKRWEHKYTEDRFYLLANRDNEIIDRNYKTHEGYVERLKNVLYEHAEYIMPGLQKLQDDSIFKVENNIYVGFAVMFIIAFLCSVVVVRRIN